MPLPFVGQSSHAMLARYEMRPDPGAVRVLIVDDQASFRSAARNVVDLTPGFVMAGEAETGEAGVEAVRLQQPDLVLMDVHLPGIDGPEASRRILGGSTGKTPTIFLLSTYNPSEYVDASLLMDCGAKAYLIKAEFGSERLSAAWDAATSDNGTRP